MKKIITSLFFLLIITPSTIKPISKKEVVGWGIASFAAGCFCTYVLAKQLKDRSIRSRGPLNQIGSLPVAYFSIKDSIYSIEDYLTIIDAIKNNPSIEGVIISIESPGGSAGASHMLYQEIKHLAEKKPVVALIPTHCYSGGYLAACGASWIIADRMAQLGNIGTRQDIFSFDSTPKGILNGFKGNISVDPIYTGKFKVMGHPHKKLTPEERECFQKDCDKGYELFCSVVEEERKPAQGSEVWGEGRVFWADDAKELGLVDQCGGWSDAKEKVGDMVASDDHSPNRSKRKIEIYTYTVDHDEADRGCVLNGATQRAMRFSTSCQLM